LTKTTRLSEWIHVFGWFDTSRQEKQSLRTISTHLRSALEKLSLQSNEIEI